MRSFKNRIGFTAVNRPNQATGMARRYMRATPVAGFGTPAAGPIDFEKSVPRHTPGLYFAEDEDDVGQNHEANLVAGVSEGKDAYRRAELSLATFYAGAAASLRAERTGLAQRAGSRTEAPLSLFLSLEDRYSLRAAKIRERWFYARLETYDDDAEVRLAVAQDPYATTTELELLSTDGDAAVRETAVFALEERAE